MKTAIEAVGWSRDPVSGRMYAPLKREAPRSSRQLLLLGDASQVLPDVLNFM